MRRLTGHRAGLLLAPLLVAAVGTVAAATPAAACQNVVSCSAGNDGGNLHAGVSYITISVNGGNYPSHGAVFVGLRFGHGRDP